MITKGNFNPTTPYFTKKGFDTLVCPWDNRENVRSLTHSAKKNGAMGVIFTTCTIFRRSSATPDTGEHRRGAWMIRLLCPTPRRRRFCGVFTTRTGISTFPDGTGTKWNSKKSLHKNGIDRDRTDGSGLFPVTRLFPPRAYCL